MATLATYDPKAPGSRLDAKDNMGKWYHATVMENKISVRFSESVVAGRIKVHFDDWSSRWDEWIDYSDIEKRTAPLGTMAHIIPPRPTLQRQNAQDNINSPLRNTPNRAKAQDKEHVVEKITCHRVRDGQLQFRTAWRDYGPSQDTWEPQENFVEDGVVCESFLKYCGDMSLNASDLIMYKDENLQLTLKISKLKRKIREQQLENERLQRLCGREMQLEQQARNAHEEARNMQNENRRLKRKIIEWGNTLSGAVSIAKGEIAG
jgi:hypothetical protein